MHIVPVVYFVLITLQAQTLAFQPFESCLTAAHRIHQNALLNVMKCGKYRKKKTKVNVFHADYDEDKVTMETIS